MPGVAGHKTREKILESACKILVSKGFSSVTHRAVAEDAGLPLGSTTYHFKDKPQLVSEALNQLLRDEQSRRLSIKPPSKASAEEVADYLIEVLLPPGFRSKNKLGILFERMVEASRSATVCKLIAEDQKDLHQTLGRTFDSLGLKVSAQLAQAVFDGRALQWLNGKGSFESLKLMLRKDMRFLVNG